jgi:proteasome alpha subunit
VSALGLANAYAQLLGNIFSESGGKPYEAELVIAEVGDRAEQDQIYRITYDGSVVDAHGFVVIGGAADAVSGSLEQTYTENPGLGEALRTAVAALAQNGNGEPRELSPAQLEVAVLDRDRKQLRKFRRLLGTQLTALLEDEPGADVSALVEDGETAADTEAEAEAVEEELDADSLIDEALDETGEEAPGEDDSTGDN